MALAKTYGHIPNIPVGATFDNRRQLSEAGVHSPGQAGIHGDHLPNGGAYSICVSQGYEDNVDSGEKIIYVGSGGQDDRGTQIANQSFDDNPNKALQISCETKRPVRVVRGSNTVSYYSPAKGTDDRNRYRYDGLYIVDKAEMRTGKSGFQMCFFELRRLREEGDGPLPHRRLLDGKKLKRMTRGSRAK